MYKFIVMFLFSLFLCGCAVNQKVVKKNRDDVLGRFFITNSSGVAAVFIDDEFVGNTPIDVKLPVGTHHLTMNVYGNIVLDTAITVTDDYQRNTNAGIVGSIIAGFIPLLLAPFPLNVVLAPLPAWIVEENVAKANTEKIIRDPYKKIELSSKSLENTKPTTKASISGTDWAYVNKDSVVHVNGAVMYYMDSEKFRFLRQMRGETDTLMVEATYLCYEESSDLVWASQIFGSTSVYRTEEFIPCEVDSLPYPSPFLSALKRMGIVTGTFGVAGAIAGESAASALAGMFAGWLLVGVPTNFISEHVFIQRNIHACQEFRSKPLVKKWYRQYPCRQNMKPTPESKNQ